MAGGGSWGIRVLGLSAFGVMFTGRALSCMHDVPRIENSGRLIIGVIWVAGGKADKAVGEVRNMSVPMVEPQEQEYIRFL